jgi:hypothetical protein
MITRRRYKFVTTQDLDVVSKGIKTEIDFFVSDPDHRPVGEPQEDDSILAPYTFHFKLPVQQESKKRKGGIKSCDSDQSNEQSGSYARKLTLVFRFDTSSSSISLCALSRFKAESGQDQPLSVKNPTPALPFEKNHLKPCQKFPSPCQTRSNLPGLVQ